ncbi:pre-mRNA-splicing helicase BRR2, partial [Pancytospora epiphaga]
MKNSVASVKGSGEVLDNTIDSAGDRVSAIEVERSGHGNKMEVWQVIHEIEGIFTEKDKSLFIEDSTIFFTTQPKFSRFEKLMLAFLNDFIRLFKRQNCFSHIFQVYQKDRAVIREYLSFIRLGPEIECPLENYVEIQPYLGTPEKSNSPQQEKTDCPHDSIHKTSNLDALNLILPDGIKLTDIQSKVVGSIIYNDKNVLISAPTGSGKTLLAIVGINNCLKSRRSGKVYYIAPMKVLIKQKVIEITEWINQKMSDTGDMGYQVIGLSSDFKTEHSQIISSDVIVGTPEKLDILLRNGHKFDLVVVDEVHLLFYDRGDVIEAIVARINCRIIAMSATIPDTELVRRFLRVPEYNCFNFDDNYRPIKVKYEYNPVENNNESRKLVVSRAINENKPLLLFVNERQSTWGIAEEIVNKICKSKSLNCRFCSNDGVDSTKVDEPSILARTSLLDSDDVTSLIDQIKDFSLFRLVAHGVGIHNAALRRNYRYVVERLFLLKAIGILVSTATLSWGVNLPCNTVIVYGEFSALDIVQMCGRAGRGVPSEEQAAGQYLACFYGKEIQDKSAQAGYLQKNICFHINAEICMGRIRSLTEAFEWLRKTFLYQKIKQKIENENREHSNPGENVGLCTVENDIRDIDSLIEKKVRNTIYQALIQMEQRRLVEHFEPTLLGRISHKFYLKLEDLEMLKSINVLFDESLFLELLGCMLEGAVKVTLPNIQVPYPTDLAVNKLLQFLLAGYNVSVDATSLLQNVLRLLSAAFEYSLAMKITSACNALQLYHRFTACVKMLNTRNSHNPTINKSNKSALKHFCKLECDNFATLLYFSTERNVFEDISINAVAYKNSDFVFLSINISAAECVQIRHIILLVSDSMDHHVLYSKVLSGTTVKVYLDGDDNMFYSLRLVSRHYAAVLKTTVLVTEAPRRPDLLSEASFRIYQEGCTHLPEYNYLVVLDDASSGDRKDVVTYYELNHIIYSEAHIISKFC